jgi:hypothetical protein
MSKSLSVASIIEKNLLSSTTPFIPLLDIEVVNPSTGVVVETLHVCRNTENLTFNGVLYTATKFDFELRSEAGAQSAFSLSITDYSKAIQGRMQAYGGGIGFNVTLIVVNAGQLNSPAELVEYFQVVGASAANYVVQFTLGAENALTVTFPKRRQTKDFCQWRYKDPDTCGYAGAMPSCDLTLQGANGCAAHANTQRFGGYPGINSNGIRYV